MSAEEQLARARGLLDLGRPQEAVVILRQLLSADPNDAEAWRMLAYALTVLGAPAEALDAANRAVALDPQDEWGHRLASVSLAAVGRWTVAVEAAQASVRLAPGNSVGHAHLARALVDRAVFSPAVFNGPLLRAARDAAARAVELGPGEPNAHYVQAYVARRRGRGKQAKAAYRRTLQLDPQHTGALVALGQLEPSFGRAANLFGAALQVDPDSAVARRNLRDVAFRLLLGSGLLALVLLAAEYFAGLTLSPPPYPPIGWLRALLVAAGLVAVVLPVLAVGRRLDRSLRPFLLRLPLRNRWVLAWVVALAGMWVALLVLPLLPAPGRVRTVQAALLLGVPGFLLPSFVVALPLALRRLFPSE